MLSITKLQNLKAIHNGSTGFQTYTFVVINHKTTKFESNSQLVRLVYEFGYRCYQSQNYKIWKQFTTEHTAVGKAAALLSIAKLQNLKAIHNLSPSIEVPNSVVINRKTTKFESNSQPIG